MLYDVLIIGAGPAGLTASIYASRYKLSNLVIGKLIGGTITFAHKVENFPGFISVSGVELGQKMAQQAKSLGAEILVGGVAEIWKDKKEAGGLEGQELFRIKTESGKEFQAKTLILAAGTERRKLSVPGEAEYLGKGVSYCSTCDAPFFRGKTVVLVGGSNAACSGALHLADFAQKIYLIYRKSQLRAEPVWVEEVLHNSKVEVVYNTNISKILGGKDLKDLNKLKIKNEKLKMAMKNLKLGEPDKVVGVELDREYQGETFLAADGVFIEIGGVPATDFVKSAGVETDEEGYIKVNEKMETNIEGIFAAGDITDKSKVLSQAIIACAQGAIAANSAFEYLKSK